MSFQTNAFQFNAFQMGANSGTLVAAEEQDVAALIGTTTRAGAMAATDEQDTFDAVGINIDASGGLAAPEAQDTFDAAGFAAHHGTLDATEEQDGMAFAVLAFSPSMGVFEATLRAVSQQLRFKTSDTQEFVASVTAFQPAFNAEAVFAVFNKVYSSIEPLYPMFRDGVTVTDSLRFAFGVALFDHVYMADSAGDLDRLKAFSELVPVTDQARLMSDFIRTFSDVALAQDSAWIVDPTGGRINDMVTVVSVLDDFARTMEKLLADVVAVTDEARPNVGPGPVDSADVSDDFARSVQYQRQYAASVTPADLLARGVGKRLATPVSVADAKAGGWGKTLADPVAVADARTRFFGKALASTAALSDATTVNTAFRRTLSDSVSMNDSFSSLLNDLMKLADTISVVDARTKAVGKAISDSCTLTDGRVLGNSRAVSDTVAVEDAGAITGQGYANNYFAEDYVISTLATFT